MKLMYKTLVSYVSVLIINMIILLLVDYFSVITIGVVLLDITCLVAILFIILYIFILKSIINLHNALNIIDFNADIIDFSKVDCLEEEGFSELRKVINKFKYLLDVISERINKINSETYKSEHDELTGCYNRVHLERVKSSYELANNFCVCFIDVNNLKRMNDEFGHEAGDALLRSASKALYRWNTIADVYRLGGDEFMFVIVDKSINDCKRMIDNWYPTVGQLNRESDGFKCVLSYGLSEGSRGDSFDVVMKKADELMYDMKVAIKKEFGEPLR